jgi:ankyrin repeat protein/Mg2+ and Co2+ transporter CorA
MPRSPSRSSDGGSQHQTRAEPRLLKAIEESRNDDAIAILEKAKAHGQPTEHLLRIGLMRAAERGNTTIAQYLLLNGAQPDGAAGGRASPLLKAVEKDHVGVVKLLLKFGGNVDAADKQGRTALMSAAWRNHFHTLNVLLRCGADVNKKDNTGRNVLHNLAADKHCNTLRDVIDALLKTNIAIDGKDGQDYLGRTPLHWAAVTGKKELCEVLLTRPRPPRAQIHAVEVREKTSLHLAVSHGQDDIVELLLRHGANVKAKSDGSWTPLHNACEKDNLKIVNMLLEAGADINAKLLNGMTPLHIAAQAGQLEVVKRLLERKGLKRAARDNFGITPFLRAAQSKRKDIATLLAPFNQVENLSEDALGACNGFNATIVDFGNFHNENKVRKRTVYELLYGRDAVNPRKPAIPILPTDSKATNFRWIHLPANNMAWVEALLTKAFIEEGASDVEGFKALERSFNHQHRGQQVHSHFMRPLCQSTPRAPKHTEESDFSDGGIERGPPQIVINGNAGLGIDTTAGAQETPPKMPVRTDTISTDQTDWTRSSGGTVLTKDKREQGKGKEKPKKQAKWSGGRQGKSGGTETPTKQPDHSSRRKTSQPLTNSGHLRSPGSPGRKDPTSIAKSNIFTFMPYLHFETDRRRQEMRAAIARAEMLKRSKEENEVRNLGLNRPSTYDEMLLRAHLTSSTVSLHVRRTLDQSFYHNIDTQSRDQDQVVYRYQMKDRNRGKSQSLQDGDMDPHIFMVDQLWMWVLGKDLIVTSFPQRWQQPKNDPLNVLDGIIEDINSKTREPVRNVYDLALIITGRCIGVFDRNRMDESMPPLMDFFEASIGDATEEETKLFKIFNVASAQASQWLQHHRRPSKFSRHLEAETRVIEHQNKHASSPHSHAHALSPDPIHEDHYMHSPVHAPLFVDKLLDIGAETDLLAETKDIRDELHMIAKVLEDQRAVLPDLELSITDIYREEHKSQSELKRRFREQLKTIDLHIKDIDRMDKQAMRIYKSITDLLDLKQKHANAFEARFARDQAADTARQSQTVMVFTIVTIVFLPLSFIAAIFTINIREFPHLGGGSEPSLPLAYVSKYMFGIGLAISIPLVVVALKLDAIGDFFREKKHSLRKWRSQSKRGAASTHAGLGTSMEKLNHDGMSYIVDTLALEEALSAGRSTMGRRSYESHYLGGASLLPVTSRGTGRTANANGHSKAEVDVVRPVPVERISTGFKLRRSADVERGV